MITLTKDILPNYFVIASPENSHYKTKTNTFDFKNRNSDILVVTVGDSWTWGTDLTVDDNEEFRTTHVFGNLISEKLNADWLNLAQNHSNNFFIAERVEELGCIVDQLNYKKIYLICTFTEVGRNFNSHHDVYIDYNTWFKHNLIDNFLEFLNYECVKRIQKVANKHGIIVKIGTTWVDAIGIDRNLLLPIPWFRLLGINCDITGYAGSAVVKRLADVELFVNDRAAYLEWFNRLADSANYMDQVSKSQLLNKYHPTVDGHIKWANYILTHLSS